MARGYASNMAFKTLTAICSRLLEIKIVWEVDRGGVVVLAVVVVVGVNDPLLEDNAAIGVDPACVVVRGGGAIIPSFFRWV